MSKNEEKLRIVYKQVGKKPKVTKIKNELEEMQKLVKGLIEVIPYKDDMLIVCNEEGKLLNLSLNLMFENDYIVGNCFIVGDDYKNADFRSLTNEEILDAKKDLIKRSFHIENEEVNEL